MFRKWKKGTHVDPQREKIKEELYAFKKTVEHGFPHHPCAFAYDPILKLVVIGTKTGAVKVFGAPGVEFTGIHPDVNQVLQLHFLHGEGRLVSILDDNTMHLWEFCTGKDDNIGTQSLVEVHASQLAGRPGTNQITEVCVRSNNDLMWVGTEGGAIYSLSLPEFEPNNDATIHQDQVMQSIPDHYKSGKALGPVEAIVEHPSNSSFILIGYSRGLVVLWNVAAKSVDKYFLNEKALESISWRSNNKEFISAHIDGSLCTWRLESSTPHTSYIPYGPFPCKAITKILWKSSRTLRVYTQVRSDHVLAEDSAKPTIMAYWNDTNTLEPCMIFSGGMPRANYGDRHCVSVVQGSKHVTFDFTSRVIDFFVICNNKSNAEWEDPQYLLVLAEEELIAIDLTKDDLPSFAPPYLASPHASAITCSTCAENVSEQVWNQINEVVLSSKTALKLPEDWPVNGGIDLSQQRETSHNLLITGHEDGSIRLWDVTGISMSPVVKLSSTNAFVTDTETNSEGYEEQFPPFRKVGEFDPYSDDPRLAIRKVSMCPSTGTIVAGGTAGQVVVFILSSESIDSLIVNHEVDILEGRADFTWKGHEKLHINEGHIAMKPGYQISNVIQCQPPASVTALNVNANWGLVGFGTGHGFVLFDYLQNKTVLSKCTLETGDHAAMEGNFSRAKSFKMSLRQSIRRIRGSFRGGGGSKRKRVSGRRRYKRDNMSQKLQEANAALVDEEETASGSGWSPPATGQRRIEARSSEDGMTGTIRCIYFASTYLRDNVSHSPTFWAGTNSGAIYVFALHVPDYSMRQAHEVTSVLGKHVQLMHRAPVIDLTVVDGNGTPVYARVKSDGKSINGSVIDRNNPHSAHHFLIVSSEEQLKVFSLPKITAKRKFKLTAIDGSLVRRVVFADFQSTKNSDYQEYGLVCLTNLGEIHILSQLPSLRPQELYPCIARDDAYGLASALLTPNGQGFYLLSPSEYCRFSLSASGAVEPMCTVGSTNIDRIGSPIKNNVSQASMRIVIEDGPKPNLEVERKSPIKPSRSPSIGHAVVASIPHSPKTPLLCDEDDDVTDDDDDDARHVEKHESVLQEAERTLAEAGGDQITLHSDGVSEDIDIQDLLGPHGESKELKEKLVAERTVAEAERLLSEGNS